MKVAVMMSTYNGERYLDAQIESLASQTIADAITLYIRDDGSTDKTFDIIEKWKSNLHIKLIKGSNLGPAKSFWDLLTNNDIQADYYAFCDQDDVWDANKLEIAISKLNAHTHLYACNCRLIDSEGAVIAKKYTENVPEISIPRLFVAGIAQGCAMVFTDNLRQFVVSRDLQCIPMHDIMVMLYALGHGDVIWDSETRFGYRVHSSNVVARENKSFIKRVRSTYWNWRNSSKNSMSAVAQEMLNKANGLSETDVVYLTLISNYKTNISAKRKLLFQKHTDTIPFRVLNSYRMRLILNLL